MKTSEHKCYPVFETNQILTSTHLNRMREYLDEENRLTRNKFIGFGIVCGLKVKMKTHGHIFISKGYGITTDGYLLGFDETKEFTRYKKYILPENLDYKYIKLNKNADVIEIFEENTGMAETLPLKDIPSSTLEDKIVVLYLELSEEILQSCTGTNCDNKGKKKNCSLKVLLLNKNDLKEEKDFLDSLNGKFELPELSIKRFRLFPLVKNIKKFKKDVELSTTFDLPEDKFKLFINEARKSKSAGEINDIEVVKDFLKQINNSDYIFQLFNNLIDADLHTDIINALKKCYDVYKPFLVCEYETNPFDSFQGKFELQIKNNVGDIQYVWDFLCELVKAYNEFREKAYKLNTECAPSIEHFPQHLLLGIVESGSTCMPQQFRYPFFQPPVYNNTAELVKEIKHLFKRLVVMIKEFKIPNSKDSKVSILPSKEKEKPLSEWSIPFYYFGKGESSSIHEVWSYDYFKRCRSRQILSYFSNLYNKTDDWIQNPLNYIHDEYPFYRIEGIHGMPVKDVYDQLEEKQKVFNLPFKTIVLHLENDPNNISIQYDKVFYDLQEEYFFHRGKLIAIINDIKKFYENLTANNKKLIEGIEKSYEQIEDDLKFKERIEVIFNFLDEFIKLFPPCLKNFNYELFKTEYKKALVSIIDFILVKQKLLENIFYEIKASKYEKEFSIGNELLNFFLKLLFKLIDSLHHTHLLRIYFGYKRREYFLIANHPSVFSNFIQKHTGIEHLAGVYKGGTFILVSEGNQVVADFSLPYICCTDDYEIPICDDENTLKNIKITPFARPDFVVTQKDKPVSIDILDNDDGFYGGDVEFVKIVYKPKNGEVKTSDKKDEVIYTPAKGFSGVDTFTYSIRNIHNKLTDEGIITVIVLEEPLRANDDFAETTINKPVDIRVMDNDTFPVGTQLKFAETEDNIFTTSLKNQFAIEQDDEGQYLRFTAASGFTGDDSCKYRIVSGDRTADASVKVTVKSIEVALEAVDDKYDINCNTPTNLNVLANDKFDKEKSLELLFFGIEPKQGILGTSTVQMISTEKGADVFLVTGLSRNPIFKYVPYSPGSDKFEYQIKQGNLTANASVVLNVTSASDSVMLVTGAITAYGKALYACNVFLKGTNFLTASDDNGKYAIRSGSEMRGQTLIFYSENYGPREVTICNGTIDIDLSNYPGSRVTGIITNSENVLNRIKVAEENKEVITDPDVAANVDNSIKFTNMIKAKRSSITEDINAGKINKDLNLEFTNAVDPIIEEIKTYKSKEAAGNVTEEDTIKYNLNLELFNTNVETLLNTVSIAVNDIEKSGEIEAFIAADLKRRIDVVKDIPEAKTNDLINKVAAANSKKAEFVRAVTALNR